MTDFFALALSGFWPFTGTVLLLVILVLCIGSVAQDTASGLATVIAALRRKS